MKWVDGSSCEKNRRYHGDCGCPVQYEVREQGLQSPAWPAIDSGLPFSNSGRGRRFPGGDGRVPDGNQPVAVGTAPTRSDGPPPWARGRAATGSGWPSAASQGSTVSSTKTGSRGARPRKPSCFVQWGSPINSRCPEQRPHCHPSSGPPARPLAYHISLPLQQSPTPPLRGAHGEAANSKRRQGVSGATRGRDAITRSRRNSKWHEGTQCRRPPVMSHPPSALRAVRARRPGDPPNTR